MYTNFSHLGAWGMGSKKKFRRCQEDPTMLETHLVLGGEGTGLWRKATGAAHSAVSR